MVFAEKGTDADFKFKLGDEIIWADDDRDYTIMMRTVVPRANLKIYLCAACDPTNPKQQLQLNVADESKMTLTNCLSVLTKVWPNLTRTGEGKDFMNYVLNSVIYKVCDSHDNCRNNVKFSWTPESFTMIFDGIEFTK